MSKICHATFYDALASIGVTVSVVQKNEGTKGVHVLSPMYVEKEHTLVHSFSNEFTDYEVLHACNVLLTLKQMYGVRQCTGFTTHRV